MKLLHLLFPILAFFATQAGQAQDTTRLQLDVPAVIEVADYQVEVENGMAVINAGTASGFAEFEVNGNEERLLFERGKVATTVEVTERGSLFLVKSADTGYRLYHLSETPAGARVKRIPFWLSVLPPLVAIGLALIFKEVVISLFVGVWTGAFIAGGLRIDSFYYFIDSILKVVSTYVIEALTDSGHMSVVIFSLLIGGMVAIISRNGGMAGVVQALSKYANSPQSSQFVTWLLGVAIFFDDYANTLIVGNTMRSVTDRFRISREKLAYIVDSTAAPVSAVAFITTWIGAELGYIDAGLSMLDDWDKNTTPYAIFLSSLKYSFYPILTLCFILMLIYFKRDYGTMYQAEVRARTTGAVAPPTTSAMEKDDENLDPLPGAPLKWYNAAVPVLVVIFMTIYGLVDTGFTTIAGNMADANIALGSHSWGEIWSKLPLLTAGEDAGFFYKLGTLIGAADSYVALLWASTSGVIVAILMTLAGRIMHLAQAISSMVTGFKAMLPALIILTLAWSLAATTEELNTAVYLSSTMQGAINPYLMPVIVFILAAFISFSTGSSWSTMAILYPIVIPTTWVIATSSGLGQDISMEILLNVISVTLGASVLGDHCSPISDTTILSSLASDCNHIDHVRTQLPYALTVGLVSLILCGVSTLLGGGWLISFALLVIGLVCLAGIILWRGKRVPSSQMS